MSSWRHSRDAVERARPLESARERSRRARARSRASSSSPARSRDRDDGAASRVRRGRWGGRTRVRGTSRARFDRRPRPRPRLGLGLRRLDHRRGRRRATRAGVGGERGDDGVAERRRRPAPERVATRALDASGATRSGFRVSGRGAVTVDACRWALGTLAHCSRAKRRETASAWTPLALFARRRRRGRRSRATRLRLKTRERAKRAGYLLLTSDVDATDGDEALRAEALGRGGGRISEKMYAARTTGAGTESERTRARGRRIVFRSRVERDGFGRVDGGHARVFFENFPRS